MLSEREICFDLAKDLKYMSVIEAVFAGEASPNVKHLFLDHLRSHQELHSQVMRLMEQRGWYPRLPGDLGYNQAWSAPYSATWQAPSGVGAPWQQVPGGAQPWQGQTGGTWPGQAGASWQPQNPFQAIGQNLREGR